MYSYSAAAAGAKVACVMQASSRAAAPRDCDELPSQVTLDDLEHELQKHTNSPLVVELLAQLREKELPLREVCARIRASTDLLQQTVRGCWARRVRPATSSSFPTTGDGVERNELEQAKPSTHCCTHPKSTHLNCRSCAC